jgi:hypothetical protein
MSSQLADRDRKRERTKDMVWFATEDRVLALVLPLLGIIAVVVLFFVAQWDQDGSAKELLATAVTAVTTLAAASGGHAAGAKRR